MTVDTLVVTRSRILRDLRNLGVFPGATVMLHASVKSVGHVVGGPDVLLDSILEAIGTDGTLMMYVGWEDSPYSMDRWSSDRVAAYEAELPPFCAATSRADRTLGILAEYLRTRPGAVRSDHPEASVAAVGARAQELVYEHSENFAYGESTPYSAFLKNNGHVLLVGASLDSLTILHYAETVAAIARKAHINYRMPILLDGETRWKVYYDIDTRDGIISTDYEVFERIAKDYITLNTSGIGLVGSARSYFFKAPSLVSFAVNWLESEFGRNSQ